MIYRITSVTKRVTLATYTLTPQYITRISLGLTKSGEAVLIACFLLTNLYADSCYQCIIKQHLSKR